MFGIEIIETSGLPEGTALFIRRDALQKAVAAIWERHTIELEPMDAVAIRKIVLGPKPDWVKGES